MNRLAVEFAGVPFKNPVVMASGTFGFGREYAQLFPIERLGGISSKHIQLRRRALHLIRQHLHHDLRSAGHNHIPDPSAFLTVTWKASVFYIRL